MISKEIQNLMVAGIEFELPSALFNVHDAKFDFEQNTVTVQFSVNLPGTANISVVGGSRTFTFEQTKGLGELVGQAILSQGEGLLKG
jgi:hypothetical protein